MARKIDPLRVAIVEALESGATTRAALRDLVAHTISPGDAFRYGQYNRERIQRARPRPYTREQVMVTGRNHLFAHTLNHLRRGGHVVVERSYPRDNDVITLVSIPPMIAFNRRSEANQ